MAMVAVAPYQTDPFLTSFLPAAPHHLSSQFAIAGPSHFLPAPPPPLAPSSSQHHEYDNNIYVALDAEFVGVGSGGLLSALARVSIVSYHGQVLLDTFCAPTDQVTDYRSWVSGIREADLINAPPFPVVQSKVRELIKGKVLVGHAIHNDLEVLALNHPPTHIRDTAHHEPLHRLSGTNRPSLRALAKIVLGLDVQTGEHSSVEDARATMSIFKAYQQQWEASLDVPAPFLPQNSRPQAFSAHSDRSSPLHNGIRQPSTPIRSFSSPTAGILPRVNLPSPMASPPPGRLNPMLDPRFSAAAMSLPSKDARRTHSPPLSVSPATHVIPQAAASSPNAPGSPAGFQPAPPPPHLNGIFSGQLLHDAFPPLETRQSSPPLSTSSRDSGGQRDRSKVVGLAHVRKLSASPSKRKDRERNKVDDLVASLGF